MKTAVCTISTKSHIFKSIVTLESVVKHTQTDVFCLVTDAQETQQHSDIAFHFLNDLNTENALKIKSKYKKDALRWALKSVYTKFLIDQGYAKVIYLDNDIYCYQSLQHVFDKLNDADVVLTPHFYPTNPKKDQNWLEANFRVGLYNAGFFGVSNNAIPQLDWWAECCIYNVKKAYWRGLFDDQKYLDLLPVKFNNVEILKHRGMNFAGWNSTDLRIDKDSNGNVLIDGNPMVFIHFTQLSVEVFSNPASPFYRFYSEYVLALNEQNPTFEFRPNKWTRMNISNYFYYLRWKFARISER